jgi:hypothetical protein
MSLSESELNEIVTRVVAALDNPVPTPLVIDNTHFAVSPGMVIQADHVNSLANQSIPKYASNAALLADWPAPPVGAMAYVVDTNILVVYDSQLFGSATNAWRPASGLRMGYGRMALNQSIPNGSVHTLLKLDAAGGTANKPGRSVWSANGEVSIPVTGTYLATGSCTWPVNTSGERRLYVRKFTAGAWTFSGVAGGAAETNKNQVGDTYLRQSVTAMLYANAGDKVGLWAQHSATVALTLIGGEDQAKFAVQLLGSD